ncbi:MAG: GIY-YIG nuclease family protein [Rhodospirillales bacterium]
MAGSAAVYIMTNRKHGTLYTGVTSALVQRVHQHRSTTSTGFAARYGCRLLVYFERHDEITTAIAREKQIKAGSRRKKIALIEHLNPAWRDLYGDII